MIDLRLVLSSLHAVLDLLVRLDVPTCLDRTGLLAGVVFHHVGHLDLDEMEREGLVRKLMVLSVLLIMRIKYWYNKGGYRDQHYESVASTSANSKQHGDVLAHFRQQRCLGFGMKLCLTARPVQALELVD